MTQRFSVLLLFLAAISSAHADDRYYLQFELFKYQQKIESGKDYVTDKEHTWSKGLSRSYLQLSCRQQEGRVVKLYSTIDHFEGIRVTHQVSNGKLMLTLTRIEVQPRLTEIRALTKSECKELTPIVTSVSESYVTAIDAAGNQTYPFGKDMSIRISLSKLDVTK